MPLRNVAIAFALGLATTDPFTIESQGSFFIGGHDVKSDALSQCRVMLMWTAGPWPERSRRL
ncbi:MAG: hypothetical protein JSS04_12685 [Proteobacteria bacterium]|nr:hypothetical protein [Pseudomonadota bacterium]